MHSSIQLPDYKPDQSVNSGVLLVAQNVYPAVDGYRPLRDVSTTSDALAAAFMGGASAISTGGTGYLLAGTATNLYKYASGAWTSILSALTITERWKFTQFGNYSIAVNGSATQEVSLSAGTASAIAAAPTGTSVCVVGDYVVIGQPDGDITAVATSAFGDHTAWTPGVDQSTLQPMQTGGEVMAVCGGEYGIILQRERIVRMTRTGDSTAPFQYDEVTSNFGCANGNTVTQSGRTIFFRSDRGFMALDDGQVLKPIGSEKVDRTFDKLVARDDYDRMYTAIDPQNKLVFWGIPGSPGTMWIYNFELDKWATAELNFTGIFPGFTTSIGLDDLSVIYNNIDTMPYTLDDPRWTGGNPRLYMVDDDRKIGTLAGDTLAARFDLGFTEFTKTRRARIRNIRPVTDATGGLSLSLDARARLGDGQNLKTATELRASGVMPIRASGRYISASLQIAAATDWSYIQGLEVEYEAGGER